MEEITKQMYICPTCKIKMDLVLRPESKENCCYCYYKKHLSLRAGMTPQEAELKRGWLWKKAILQ